MSRRRPGASSAAPAVSASTGTASTGTASTGTRPPGHTRGAVHDDPARGRSRGHDDRGDRRGDRDCVSHLEDPAPAWLIVAAQEILSSNAIATLIADVGRAWKLTWFKKAGDDPPAALESIAHESRALMASAVVELDWLVFTIAYS